MLPPYESEELALTVRLALDQHRDERLLSGSLQVALESLSGSLGTLGLGRFDVQLGYRSRGVLVIIHQDSPFEILFADRDGQRNELLAGLHAGFLSYLSGRSLIGRELGRPLSPGLPCRLVVGTETRLKRLFEPVEGSPDAELLSPLGVRWGAAEVKNG